MAMKHRDRLLVPLAVLLVPTGRSGATPTEERIRRASAVAILVLVALIPALGHAQSPSECIRVDTAAHKFRNVCSKNVNIAWCISQPDSGVNPTHSIVCGNSASYYGFAEQLPPGASIYSRGDLGGIRWAACFWPKRPVATQSGGRYVCRNEAVVDSSDQRKQKIDKYCKAFRRTLTVDLYRKMCDRGSEASCDVIETAKRMLNTQCKGW